MPLPGVSLFTVVDHKNYTALLFFKIKYKKIEFIASNQLRIPSGTDPCPHHHLNVLGYVIGRHKEVPLIHLSIA